MLRKARRLPILFARAALVASALNLPLYAGDITIHVQDVNGAAVANAAVYGLVYRSQGPDPVASDVKMTDSSGNAAFSSLDATKDYTFIASAPNVGPMARTQMMSGSAPHAHGDTTGTTSTIALAQDLSGRGTIHLTVQHGTANAFIMANVHKPSNNTDVQVGGCKVDGIGSDCTIDLPNIPVADANVYEVGVFDANKFNNAGGGVGTKVNVAITAGGTANFTLDLNNAFPPNVSSAGDLQPDANNAVIKLSLRAVDNTTPIPNTWVELQTKDGSGNLFPSGGGQTDAAGVIQFRVPANSYFVRTGFTCPTSTCYDGLEPNPSSPDITVAPSDLNNTVTLTKTVPAAPQGTVPFRVEVAKASNLSVLIPYSGVNLGPDWSQWKTTNGAPVCDGSDAVASNPGKTQKNTQAADGTALLENLTDGNYMLQIWTPFSQGGTTFNGGADHVYNWGNGLRGCNSQIASSVDDLRITVNHSASPRVKVFDTSDNDVTSSYITDTGTPTIKVPVTTASDSATGHVSGTITFPEATNALVSITLFGQCDSNGCSGNETTVLGPNATPVTSVNYDIPVEPVVSGQPASYYMEVKCETYGPVLVDGSDNAIHFPQNGGLTVTHNITMAKSGIVTGRLLNPDGSVFMPVDGMNATGANISFQGEHSWANAQVQRDGTFRGISLLPGKYDLVPQIWNNSGSGTTLTGRRPAESVIVSAGQTTQRDVQLANGDYVLPVWDLTNAPALLNVDDPTRGIRGETYNVMMMKNGAPVDGDLLRSLLTHDDEKEQFNYFPSATNRNPCGPSATGWCGQFIPDGFTADYRAVRQGGMANVNGTDIYSYVLFLQKQENVVIDPSKTSLPTVNTNAGTVKPIRVSFTPNYSGSDFITIKGTVKAANMFRRIDFAKMNGDFQAFVKYIPVVAVTTTSGQLLAAALVTPSPTVVDDTSQTGQQLNAAIASGDYDTFMSIVGNLDWNFVIRGIPKADKYLLALTSPNYPPLAKTISGLSDYNWLVNWDTDGSAGGTIAGVVTDDSSNPIASANVEIRTRGVVKNMTTASDGSYKFEGLPVGNYKVTASAPNKAPRAQRVLVTGTTTETVNFQLPAADATISGTVTKYTAVSGAVLKVNAENVKVLAYDDTYNVAHPSDPLAILETETDANGAYTLVGAQSTHVYKVFFQLAGYFVDSLSVTAVVGDSPNNDLTLRLKGLSVKVKIAHDDENSRYVVSILNPDNFDSGTVLLGDVATPFDTNTATDITGSFAQQPDGSLIGYIADSVVGSSNKQLHFIAVPSDGSPNVINDYIFGPTLTSRLDQPIDDLLVSADGDGDITGADGRTTITPQPGALLAGNDPSVLPSMGLANYSLAGLGTGTSDNGSVIGNGVQIQLTNTQADPDRPIDISMPVDNSLVEGGIDPTRLELYRRDSSGQWQPVTDKVAYDPVTGTVEGELNVSQNVTERPLGAPKPASAMGGASVQKPLSLAAVKTATQVKRNVSAASTAAGIFAVGIKAGAGVSSTTGYHQYNFPNPFNLKDKTVAFRSGTGGLPTTIRGTYIVVAPTGSGTCTVKVRIYDVAGEMVRELVDDNATAGRYNYFHWDGKNTSGDDVASGVYFAKVDAPGAPKKEPIKLVVVK